MIYVAALYGIIVPHDLLLTAAGRRAWDGQDQNLLPWLSFLSDDEWAQYVTLPPNDADDSLYPGSVIYGWRPEELNGALPDESVLFIVKRKPLFRVEVAEDELQTNWLYNLTPPECDEWAAAARRLSELCPGLPDPPMTGMFLHLRLITNTCEAPAQSSEERDADLCLRIAQTVATLDEEMDKGR